MVIKRGWAVAAVGALALMGACTPPPPPKDCSGRTPGADLKYCDLHGEIFAGTPDPDGGSGDYTEMDLSDSDISYAYLADAVFGSGAKFDRASFRGSDLRRADFREDAGVFNTLSFKNNDFSGAKLSNASFDTAFLSNGNFANADMRNMDVYYGGLSGTFTGADLSGSSFFESSSASGDMRGASLVGTNWIGLASLDGDLRGADLTGASMAWAYLSGDLQGANLHNVTINISQVISANLTGADLTGATFTSSALEDVDLTNADLTGATFLTDPGSGPNTFENVTWSNTTCPNGVVQSTPCL